ncbi:6-phosphogluconolactonase-like protein 1 [Nakaseomyces bracarensis]|uniref:6-phosphogluconolactonase-like protein n=1 Tax=Nakaseomyces bracarensis TaxID=273131 RepID=A0ABR4NN38_9SACH
MTTAPKLITFESGDHVAAATVQEIIKSQNAKLKPELKKKKSKRLKKFRIALSSGQLLNSIPEALLERRDEIDWANWDVFLVDECLVPFHSSYSNYGRLKERLIDPLIAVNSPLPQIYHIEEAVINNPQAVADNYEKKLIQNFASRDSVRLPTFDIILLGCEPDGHIASLFPQFQDHLREDMAWVIPVTNAPHGPANRISMTIPVICNASCIIFAVTGKENASIMKKIVEAPTCGLPSTVVSESATGRVSWFVESDALKGVMIMD